MYSQGYQSLFTVSGKFGQDSGLNFTRKEYKRGHVLYGFEISPSLCGSGGPFEPTRTGSLQISIEFQKALPTTVTLICYFEFGQVSIDK